VRLIDLDLHPIAIAILDAIDDQIFQRTAQGIFTPVAHHRSPRRRTFAIAIHAGVCAYALCQRQHIELAQKQRQSRCG
jgi:hypothetical protein